MKMLVIDADHELVEALALGLQLQWHNVEVLRACSDVQGLALFFEAAPALTLLGEETEGANSWALLRSLRETSDAPVIMLSSHSSEMDKVKGLARGADDYMVKPFGQLELFARIRAVLRREDRGVALAPLFSTAGGDSARRPHARLLSLGGKQVRLTNKEYKLLLLLMRNAGRPMSFDTLLSRVWGEQYRGRTTYLKTYIRRLRAKLDDNFSAPRYIATERGIGYRFLLPGTLARSGELLLA